MFSDLRKQEKLLQCNWHPRFFFFFSSSLSRTSNASQNGDATAHNQFTHESPKQEAKTCLPTLRIFIPDGAHPSFCSPAGVGTEKRREN
jgi:hypothetical protein